MRIPTSLSVLTLLLAACTASPPPKYTGGLVEGEARVMSVNEALGQAILEIKGYRVCAYWQTEVALGQGYETSAAGPLQPDAVHYREPVTRRVKFPAKPGDRITYTGMQMGPELYLRGVEVQK